MQRRKPRSSVAVSALQVRPGCTIAPEDRAPSVRLEGQAQGDALTQPACDPPACEIGLRLSTTARASRSGGVGHIAGNGMTIMLLPTRIDRCSWGSDAAAPPLGAKIDSESLREVGCARFVAVDMSCDVGHEPYVGRLRKRSDGIARCRPAHAQTFVAPGNGEANLYVHCGQTMGSAIKLPLLLDNMSIGDTGPSIDSRSCSGSAGAMRPVRRPLLPGRGALFLLGRILGARLAE